jgi:FMN phosphatase YigB (HAD superfamily)
MEKPEAVVFDLGKVLVDFDYRISSRKIAEHGSIPFEDVQAIIDHSPLLLRYETGEMSTQSFFEEIKRRTGFRGSIEEFRSTFADIFNPIPEMVELQEQLRMSGIPTFIFSNTNEIAAHHIRRNFPFFGTFSGYVLSYEHGAMKPDQALYERVEEMTCRNGKRLLYLDDRIENVEAGRKRGWRTIHHQNPRRSIERIKKLGLLSS